MSTKTHYCINLLQTQHNFQAAPKLDCQSDGWLWSRRSNSIWTCAYNLHSNWLWRLCIKMNTTRFLLLEQK